MTPELVGLFDCVSDPRYTVELTKGTDFKSNPIYGVTLWRETDDAAKPYTNYCPEISEKEPFVGQMFQDRADAERHVRFLKGRVALAKWRNRDPN